MKNKLIHILLPCIIILAISCQSKDKAVAPNSIEKISTPEQSTSDLIKEEIKETAAKPNNETSKKTNDKDIKTKANINPSETKHESSKAKKVEEDAKKKLDEIVNIPESTPTTQKTIPTNTTVNKTTSTSDIPTVTDTKVKEIIDEKVKETVSTKPEKPEKPLKINVPVGYPNHKLFDSFLKKYVSDSGNVNYSEIKKSESTLDAYLTTLENTKFNTTWSREDKLAFWINAYNAYTIKLILNNYPVTKITDLHSGKPWDHKWIKLNGKTLSLNNIENDIIRPEFKEPRIHFAVNCAAKSCPPILNAAFTAGNLESKLESQTKKFINNSAFNTLGKSEITISKIFDWYAADFGDVASYIARYADTPVKSSATVKFNEYNWNLNEK